MEALDVGGKEAALAATNKAGQRSDGRVLFVELKELKEGNPNAVLEGSPNAILRQP